MPAAKASPKVWRAAILATAAEAALATTSLIKDRNSGKSVKADWSIRFSDRNWELTIKGSVGDNAYRYTLAGFLWGDDNEDWLVSYSGIGSNGQEPIFISGKAIWKYDAKLSDHVAMDFDNVVKFGEHSTWGWVKGAEIFVGGTIGGAAGVITVGGTPAAIIVGVAGAIGGAAALVDLSNVVKEFVESEDPVPPKELPKTPPVPEKEQILPPTKDKIVIAVSKELVQGTGPDEKLFLAGSFKGSSGTGALFER